MNERPSPGVKTTVNVLPRRAFRARRLVASLNVIAVATSLAALTSAALSLHDADVHVAAALSTIVTGTLWAAALRAPAAPGRVRVGWLLSPVLACASSMLCVAFLTPGYHAQPLSETVWTIVVGGGLVGAILWLPALALVLLLFGLPIARAQRLAERGLAGADRGEIVIGVASTALAAVAAAFVPPSIHTLLAAVAMGCGLSAATLAWLRERARRDFVRSVEAGLVPQFRVEPTAEGKALVRVTTTGAGYRVADVAEEIATLSPGGEVVRAHGR